MQTSNEWFVARTESEGYPHIVRGRLFLDSARQSGRFPTRIALVWDYAGDDKRLPNAKESEALDMFNEKIKTLLEEREAAVLTAIYIGGRQARYEYYAADTQKFSDSLHEVLRAYPPLPIHIGAKSDPEWSGYTDMILQFAMQP